MKRTLAIVLIIMAACATSCIATAEDVFFGWTVRIAVDSEGRDYLVLSGEDGRRFLCALPGTARAYVDSITDAHGGYGWPCLIEGTMRGIPEPVGRHTEAIRPVTIFGRANPENARRIWSDEHGTVEGF